MKIYIASSWKNVHAVEMLTVLLRDRGHEVISFVENNYGEVAAKVSIVFEEWILTPKADSSFKYDSEGAMYSDLVIYLSPSGKDAAAECGMSYAKGIPILGLHAKGEDFGLMRKMINWFDNYIDLLVYVTDFNSKLH